jgi:hypothetical protein
MILKVSVVYKLSLTILLSVMIACVGCEKLVGMKEPPADPVAVFDECWQVVDKNYALFTVKNINWDSVYAVTRPLVNPSTTESGLFKILADALGFLKDGHVTLDSKTSRYTYEEFYKGFPQNFNFENVKKTYLHNEFRQTDAVVYKIVDNVGYLYYASFAETISDNDLVKVMNELSSTKGLILDVRSNSGGNLSNANKLFSHFIAAQKLVKYEVQKNGAEHNDFDKKQAVYASPAATGYYNKPVVVLTNRSCFSACNDFVMYMSYLSNVRIVGDQTGGGGSIPAEYLLANGWTLRYSSSLTLSPDNVSAENGILPDVYATITPIDETNGKDPILEKAYQLLR